MRRILGVGFLASAVAIAAGAGCSDSTTNSEFAPTGTEGGVGSSGDIGGGFKSGDKPVPSPPPEPTDGSAGDGPVAVCGDGVLGGSEACDDGDTDPLDGCSATCTVESDYVCNVPGKPCALIGTCGDGMLKTGELCDDANGESGDGCSASCQIEPGWICPRLGASCAAASCGDGFKAGAEECDDGDSTDGNGCSNACRIKDGFQCPVAGTPCTATTCGDNLKQGTEQCDDGNVIPYDGCSPLCTKEPTCPKTGGVCTGACGDGIIFPGEGCDDGNTKAGDGCSATCTVEPGFTCSAVTAALPTTLNVPIIYRDFSRGDKPTVAAADGFPACDGTDGCPNRHPDFNIYGGGLVTGMVKDSLDAQGKPELACSPGAPGCSFLTNVTTADGFKQWYRDVPGTPGVPTSRINHTFAQTLPFTLSGGAYEFSDSTFFPLDGLGFGNQYDSTNDLGGNHNFHFTSELRFWFYYDENATPPPKFDFTGDDDVWVFVNGRLAVDIGGVHVALDGSLELTKTKAASLGMVTNKVYEFALFQAERNRSQSNYKATLSGFVRAISTCVSVCGDGIKTRSEACDDGVNNDKNDGGVPSYGKCSSDCASRGAFCGDGVLQAGNEVCDDGAFNGGYGKCKTDCSGPGPKCGDSILQAAYGEVCDDGAMNDTNVPPASTPYGKCSADCRSRPRCGDGIRQDPEFCDPPNTATCDATCNGKMSGPN